MFCFHETKLNFCCIDNAHCQTLPVPIITQTSLFPYIIDQFALTNVFTWVLENMEKSYPSKIQKVSVNLNWSNSKTNHKHLTISTSKLNIALSA